MDQTTTYLETVGREEKMDSSFDVSTTVINLSWAMNVD